MAMRGRRRGPGGDVTRPKRPVPEREAAQVSEEVAAAVVPSVEAEGAVAGPEGGQDAVEEQTTAAPVGPPKPKHKQSRLVAAGTFSLPGTGRAAALRSPGLVRGRIGPPGKPFSGKKRRRGTEVLPDEIGSRGNVAAVRGGNLEDEEYAKLMASKVLAGGF